MFLPTYKNGSLTALIRYFNIVSHSFIHSVLADHLTTLLQSHEITWRRITYSNLGRSKTEKLCFIFCALRSRDGSVSIALGYGRDDRWFESRQGLGILLFTTASRTTLKPTQPPNQWVPGAPYLGLKRPERETGHSPPLSAKVKNAWSYTFTPHGMQIKPIYLKSRGNKHLSTNNCMINLPVSFRTYVPE
jgi:hypothetical protein